MSRLLPHQNYLSLVYARFYWSLLSFVLLICPSNAFGVEWTKTIGGQFSDLGFSIRQTTDGGFIIAGMTYSYGAGDSDVYLIKTDQNGNKTWEKPFGGTGYDSGACVQQTTDGGFIVSGTTCPGCPGGVEDSNVYLIKTDQNGNLVWEKTFGGSAIDRGAFVQQTTDGGYIIAGDTQTPTNNFDAYLIKTDPNGNLVWEKTFGGSDVDFASSVQQTTEGGYIFAGYTYLYKRGAYQIYLVKTDQSGEEVWRNTFGGWGLELGAEVRQTTDEGYIVVGDTQPSGIRYQNVCLIKTDPNGNKVWGKNFGGLKQDRGSSVQQTTDEGYIIAGSKTVPRSNTDCYLVKTDQNGNKVWEKTFGEKNKINDCFSVQQTMDGGYIAVGDSQVPGGYYDVYLVYFRP